MASLSLGNSPRATHKELESYMETWAELLAAADGYEPLADAGSMIMEVFQDDHSKWYGEILLLCHDVVAAMHVNECQGDAEMFDPATSDCNSLSVIVAEALERADAHVKQAGPDHPIYVKMSKQNAEEAGAAGGEPRRISRPNSFSSITSFLRTESGASRIGQGTFSMKQLRDSIIFLKPTAAGAPRDVARREKDEDEKRERLRYIQDGPRIRDRGGERDRSEESERERERESPSPERQREKGRGRDRERKEKRMPRMTSDLPPHPSTLLEIPDEDIDRWLSGSVGNSAHNSFRKSKVLGGFKSSRLFDSEKGRTSEHDQLSKTVNPLFIVAGGIFFIAVVAIIGFLVVTNGGRNPDIFKQISKYDNVFPVGAPANNTTVVQEEPVAVASIPPPRPCTTCTTNMTEPGCFLNISDTSACTFCAPCSTGTQRQGCEGNRKGMCVGCDPGTYKGVNDASECVACGKETYMTTSSATACASCADISDNLPSNCGLVGCGGTNAGTVAC